MILLDFGGTIHAAIAVELSRSGTTITDEGFLRHLILSQIRAVNAKYSKNYGELVICLDDHTAKNWRKDIFPYYKANRKASRDASSIQWNEIFQSIAIIIEEIKENFPYKVISVPELEADDIIAIIAKHAPELSETNILGNMEHPVLIVSNDKDMKQLQKYKYVTQYVPRKHSIEKRMSQIDYNIFVVSHILNGDKIDGIPNVRSDADTFVTTEKRQKPISSKFVRNFLNEGINILSDTEKRRYEDNKKIIDVDFIPDKYNKVVLDAYKNYKVATNQMKCLSFLTSKKLKDLSNRISDFW